VTVRYPTFLTRSHGTTLREPTTDAAVVEAAALTALETFDDHRPVRLLGLRAELEHRALVQP
jgi:hypothetical protein